MVRQPQWNLYEAAILLDGFLKVQSATLTLAEANRAVSSQLRTMAKNSGIDVDDTYRNTNGISFQMVSMESAYFGKTKLKPATHLFIKIVEIYRTDIKEYQRLLKEAQAMANKQDVTNEETFMAWLASKVSPAQLSELYGTYEEIEKFCRRVKVLRQPLFDIFDYTAAKKVQQTIESNKAFRFMHRRHISKYISAASFYCKYLKELITENKADYASATETYPDAEKLPQEDVTNTDSGEKDFHHGGISKIELVKNVLMVECKKIHMALQLHILKM